jgi:hypothetical protein
LTMKPLAFNPLRVDPLPANQVPYLAAAAASADNVKTGDPPTSSTLLERLAPDEVQHVPLRRGDRSRKEPSRFNTCTVLKSATRGQSSASPRPAVTAKSLSVNKLFLVGWKLKRFFLALGNFVTKVSKYNPVGFVPALLSR